MDSFIAAGVPEEVAELIKTAGDVPVADLARRAAQVVAAIDGAEAQSNAGRCMLNYLRPRADESQITLIDRALEVLDKFPNFPRPRAAVIRRALETLGKQ